MPFKRLLIYAALVFLGVFSLYGILLDPSRTFAGMDFLNLGFPRVLLARKAFASGHLPLWNPMEWRGAPLLATSLGALLYPPTWIAMLLPLPWGLQLFIFLHLVAGALGTGLLCRHMFRASLPACLFCAIAFAGSGFFSGRIEQHQVVAVNCLLPWLTLSLLSVLPSNSHTSLPAWRLPMAPALVFAGMLLAGHPQYALLNLGGACLLVVLFEMRNIRTWHRTLPAFAWKSAIAIGAAASLAAIQLVPTWELGQLGERIWPWPQPLEPSFHPAMIPAFFIPGWFHRLAHTTGRPFGYTEVEVYSGLLTSLFALAAIIRATIRRRSNHWTIPLFLTFLITLLYATGPATPLAPLVLKIIPFLGHSRGAARILNVTILCWILLAGSGLDQFFQWIDIRTQNRRLARFLPAAVVLVLVGDLFLSHHHELTSVMVPRGALTLQNPFRKGWKANQAGQPESLLYRFMMHDSDFYLDNSLDAVAERQIRLQPNSGEITGIPSLDGYEEGLLPTRAFANLERRFNRNLRTDSPDAALLAFMGANTMLTEYPLPLPDARWDELGPGLLRPSSVPGIQPGQLASYRLFRSHFPPAIVLDRDTIASLFPSGSFETLMKNAYETGGTVRIPPGTQWTSHPLEKVTPELFRKAVQGAGIVSIHRTWNAIDLEINAPQATARTLLLLQSPFPGWKLQLAESTIPSIKPLCSLFSEFLMPVEQSVLCRIRLVYRPCSFRIGLFISLLFLLVLSERSVTASIARFKGTKHGTKTPGQRQPPT